MIKDYRGRPVPKVKGRDGLEDIHYLRDKLFEYERKGIGTKEEYIANKAKLAMYLEEEDNEGDHIYLLDDLSEEDKKVLSRYRLQYLGYSEDYEMEAIKGNWYYLDMFVRKHLKSELEKASLMEPEEVEDVVFARDMITSALAKDSNAGSALDNWLQDVAQMTREITYNDIKNVNQTNIKELRKLRREWRELLKEDPEADDELFDIGRRVEEALAIKATGEDNYEFVEGMRHFDYVIGVYEDENAGKFAWYASYEGDQRSVSNFDIYADIHDVQLSGGEEGILSRGRARREAMSFAEDNYIKITGDNKATDESEVEYTRIVANVDIVMAEDEADIVKDILYELGVEGVDRYQYYDEAEFIVVIGTYYNEVKSDEAKEEVRRILGNSKLVEYIPLDKWSIKIVEVDIEGDEHEIESSSLLYWFKDNKATDEPEEADDILFALQVMYGEPKYTYSDFQKMKLSQEEINEALAYVKKKGYNKFTFFEDNKAIDANSVKEDELQLVETIGDYTIKKNNDDFLKFAVFYKGQIIAETTTVAVAKRQIKQHMNDTIKPQILSQLAKHFKDRFNVFIFGNNVEISSDTVASSMLFDEIYRKNIFGKLSNNHMSAPYDEDFVLLKLDKMKIGSLTEYADDNKANDEDNPYAQTYRMLSRLKQDALYFLGNGNRSEKYLWALNVEDHIAEMRKHYDELPEGEKPEWLTEEDIDQFEKEMTSEPMNKAKDNEKLYEGFIFYITDAHMRDDEIIDILEDIGLEFWEESYFNRTGLFGKGTEEQIKDVYRRIRGASENEDPEEMFDDRLYTEELQLVEPE